MYNTLANRLRKVRKESVTKQLARMYDALVLLVVI